VALAPEKIEAGRYFGVRVTPTYKVGGLDIALFIYLLLLLILPGLLWWFFYLRHDTYHVSLTGEHGHAELRLFTTKNEDLAVDIAETIANVCRLPFRVG
jgi:hypothetical protein